MPRRNINFIFWIIEDDDVFGKDYRDQILNCFEHVEVRLFTHFNEAIDAEGQCDCIITDLSAVSPICRGPEDAYRLIQKFVPKHPNAPILIVSGTTSSYFECVEEGVKTAHPEAIVGRLPMNVRWSAFPETLHEKLNGLIKFKKGYAP